MPISKRFCSVQSLLAVLLLLWSGIVSAQTMKTVTGTVLEEDGQPALGVTVMIKGTTIGMVTDHNGTFSLRVPDKQGQILVFSCIGKVTQEHPLNRDNYRITLLDDSEELIGAVVNTGYQKLDRRMSASAISSIAGEDVLQNNAISVDNMLQGKIPGLMVLGSSSTPGAATKIRIRGTSTISGNREPLWVVDGVILDDPVSLSTEELNDLDNVNLIGNAISGLNPIDIESIDVLKDASATAIYGVRAANGVIVVTTKKGRTGTPRVNYAGSVTVTERPGYNRLQRMNSQERVDVSREIEQKGLTYRFVPARVGYEGLLYDLYDKNIDYDTFREKVADMEVLNTDWFDAIYRTSVSQRHNVSISGGTNTLNYYVSGSFNKENANVKGTGVTSYNVMAKTQARFRDNLIGTFQVRANTSAKDYLHSSISPYGYAYNTSRAIPLYNEDGSLAFYNKSMGNQNPLTYNVLHEIAHSGQTINNDGANFNANLEWTVITGLRLTGTLAMNIANTTQKSWFDEQTYAAASMRMLPLGVEFPTDDPTEPFRASQCRLPYGGELRSADSRNFGYTARFQTDYNKLFNSRHNMTLAAGTEARSTRYTGISTVQWGYLPDRGEKFVQINPAEWPAYGQMVLESPDVVTNRLSNYLSFYAIASYAYRSRYIINANVRADGSNKFGQDKSTRFLPIWSVSARWNIMNEPFFKDVMWMNELALRTSYGIQGNVSDDQTPNMIIKMGGLDPFSGDYISTISKLPNRFLKWEKTNSFDVALDFSFLDNRLGGTVEYYYKTGHDQIVSTPVSPTTGSSTMSLNVGDIMNKGYEFILNAVPVRTKDFRWSLSLNSARNINRVTRGGAQNGYTWEDYVNGRAVLKGYALNSFFAYKYAGLNEQGLPTFKDTEEGEDTTFEQMMDQVFDLAGNRVPLMQGGFSSNFSWKGLTLGLFFSYQLGAKGRLNYLYSNSGQYLPNPEQNMSSEFVDRWRQPGDEQTTDIPALSTNNMSFTSLFGSRRQYKIADNGWQMYNQSDLRVVRTDFLRLRSAYLRYNLPQDFCKKLRVQYANIRFEAYNLFLLASKDLKGQDPEQIGLGSFGATTPPVSSFSLSLDLTF
ncbi:MAG: SusC/RagA family TonB-linked outer membrane protein [Bacteroidales bacterium]|nr:SusC/RagA family TonB-linked outer membrane protein [Bacteroidales bacterium]